MAYTINLTNGTILTTVADGTVNSTSSSLTLIGKNYAGYGDFLNENFVHILENFASSSNPTNALTGQLWWDSAGNLKVYTGSIWKTLSTVTSSNSAPTSAVTGNSWWDTFNQQLNVYNGTSWTLIGPAYTTSTGQSGTIVGTIIDSATNSHVVVNVYVENTLVGIISKDTTYTPQTLINGFAAINPGFNLSTDVANNKFQGTATNSDKLGSVLASNYARTDTAATFNSTVNVLSASGLTVGSSNNFTIGHSGSLTRLVNNVNNANIAVIANVSGTPFTAITVDGSTGTTIIANLSTSGAFETSGYIRTTQGDNATSAITGAIRVVGGIGLSGNLFTSSAVNAANVVVTANVTTGNVVASRQIRVTNGVDATSSSTGDIVVSGGIGLGGNVWTAGNVVAAQGFVGNVLTTGSSSTQGNITGNWLLTGGSRIQATYADLAERFEADQAYEPGTVVQWGGEKEITAVRDELCIDVCGVISETAAYLMNACAGSSATHPAIALSGRVPVKVVGKVRKHDRLVSAGNGLARVAKSDETNPFTVIGRSLQDKSDAEVGLVTAMVSINK